MASPYSSERALAMAEGNSNRVALTATCGGPSGSGWSALLLQRMGVAVAVPVFFRTLGLAQVVDSRYSSHKKER
jgi:hypothetical protein